MLPAPSCSSAAGRSSSPSSARAAAASSSSASSRNVIGRDLVRVRPVRHGRALVGRRRELARLQHLVEDLAGRDPVGADAALPHRPPHPHPGDLGMVLDGGDDPVVRHAVDRHDPRPVQLDQMGQAVPQKLGPARPAGLEHLAGRDVLGEEALPDGDRGRVRLGGDDRLHVAGQPPGDRHQPGQVAHAGAVVADHQHPARLGGRDRSWLAARTGQGDPGADADARPAGSGATGGRSGARRTRGPGRPPPGTVPGPRTARVTRAGALGRGGVEGGVGEAAAGNARR